MTQATTPADPNPDPRLERLGLADREDAWRSRYLLSNFLVDPELASKRKRFEALSRFVRDLLADRWVMTRRAREAANPKRVYYLSMEYLIGRTLNNNILNLAAEPLVQEVLEREGWDLSELAQKEPDAGLGNGGLGRLAACFIDSLATMQYSAIGYGLRYEYGIFRQSIRNGYQVEEPDNWLRQPDPWEIRRAKRYDVHLGASIEFEGSAIRIVPNLNSSSIGASQGAECQAGGGPVQGTARVRRPSAIRQTISPQSIDQRLSRVAQTIIAGHRAGLAHRHGAQAALAHGA